MPSFSRVYKWIFLENTSIRSQRQSQNASVHDFVTTREFYKLETRSGEDNNNNTERSMRSINHTTDCTDNLFSIKTKRKQKTGLTFTPKKSAGPSKEFSSKTEFDPLRLHEAPPFSPPTPKRDSGYFVWLIRIIKSPSLTRELISTISPLPHPPPAPAAAAAH